MTKEFLLALLSFAVTAIVIIILMTAAGNALFPSAVHLVETRLESPPTGKADRLDPAPPTVKAPVPENSPPAPEPVPEPTSAAEPEPVPEPAAEPEPIAAPEAPVGPSEVRPPEPPGPGEAGADLPPSAPPATEIEPEVPTLPAETTEAPPEMPASTPRTAGDGMTDDPERGEILPLGDGRVAYKVQSGDTFSQICKKVIGTGRPEVWRKAAEMMGIDYRTIRPGMVLIFDKPVLALGDGG